MELRIEGQLLASDLLDSWLFPSQYKPGGDFNYGVLQFDDASNFNITGGGTVDGQGFPWWTRVFETGRDERPHLIVMQRGTNLFVHDLHLRNAPMFHLKVPDVVRLRVRNLDVYVDVFQQKQLYAKYNVPMLVSPQQEEDVEHKAKRALYPMFPLNTDGVDPSGVDIVIENLRVENYDDAVAVKPNNAANRSPCTDGVTVRNATVTYSVGMSIGSVPPSTQHNCIRNVLIENVTMHEPIKAIFVKSNPGTRGTGENF